MSARFQTEGEVQADNEQTRVPQWNFAPNAESGRLCHEHNYVVVSLRGGELLLENKDEGRQTCLTAGQSYVHLASVEHNVINVNRFSFVGI